MADAAEPEPDERRRGSRGAPTWSSREQAETDRVVGARGWQQLAVTLGINVSSVVRSHVGDAELRAHAPRSAAARHALGAAADGLVSSDKVRASLEVEVSSLLVALAAARHHQRQLCSGRNKEDKRESA